MNVSWSHCVLRAADIDVMIDFYCSTLGFEVSDRGEIGPDAQIVFLSGDASDHHQLALMSGQDTSGRGSLDHNAFRVGSITDVKTVLERVSADDRVGDPAPFTHGNAVSVYFSDPERNGIEVFCDTPWHVPQPVLGSWDPADPDDEILEKIRVEYASVPGAMPMGQYRSQRAAHFSTADG